MGKFPSPEVKRSWYQRISLKL